MSLKSATYQPVLATFPAEKPARTYLGLKAFVAKFKNHATRGYVKYLLKISNLPKS